MRFCLFESVELLPGSKISGGLILFPPSRTRLLLIHPPPVVIVAIGLVQPVSDRLASPNPHLVVESAGLLSGGATIFWHPLGNLYSNLIKYHDMTLCWIVKIPGNAPVNASDGAKAIDNRLFSHGKGLAYFKK